jgi:two-component system CheB/CheR fusion protein
MIIRRIERVEDYGRLLEDDPGEAADLCRDVLISVTRFFRDPEVFDALQQSVLPTLLQERSPDHPIRVWVPGCATGEEVYSLAICLLEHLGPRADGIPMKLFGTDLVESVIRKARSGSYAEHIAADVGAERLRRFFVKNEGGYEICKAVRDLCVFARQDATRDPPFSNLDLISCRNVLIYLGPVLQKRILPLFHYALREQGFLVLGPSERVSAVADLFSVVDRKRRIYARRSIPTRLVLDSAAGQRGSAGAGFDATGSAPVPRAADVVREADRVLLARYAPAGVLIDETLEILQFRGATGAFLEPAPGTPSRNLRSMARRGLLPDLAEAVEEAKRRNAAVVRDGLSVSSDDHTIDARIEVIPVPTPASSQRSFLVLFHRVAATGGEPEAARRAAEQKPPESRGLQRRLEQLERELAAAQEYHRAAVEEREVVTEELRAANEELLSGNEELQSTNEELQTAHEELQATNEELLTVNEELAHRNEEATLLGNDLTNLLSSVEIPIIMLGRDLRIRRFTPSAAKLLNLIPSDLERPIRDLKVKVDVPDLEDLLVEVLDQLSVLQRDVQDGDGRWHSLCLRPYRSQDGKIDGVVITLTDIDAIKRSAQRLAAARDFAESIVMAVREPLLVLDHELRVEKANDACGEDFLSVPTGIAANEMDRVAGQWYVPGLRERLEAARDGEEAFDDFLAEADFPGLGHRFVRANARRVRGADGEHPLLLLAIEDVTEERAAEAERALMEQKLQEAERMRSLGVLAGGIAHDFNNILTAILGYANLVQTGLSPDSGLKPHVELIEESALSAAELCQQMLAYSGKDPMIVRRFDVSALVREFTFLLEASAGKKAILVFELADGLPAIEGDVVQLQQVIMNLVINAAEAIGEPGGTITVRTGRTHPDADSIATARVAADEVEGEYVYLEVQDDGCGMDEETQAHAFEPFFSLKFVGRGLGLAAVVGIVQGHRGVLTLDSAAGRGSTFRVLFPAAGDADEAPQPLPGSDATDAAWQGRGTVLVIDDAGRVRALLERTLEHLGLRVLVAEGGRAGVELFRERAHEVDLVLLDLTMTHRDGAGTFRELRELRADAQVVLMSDANERQALAAVGATQPAGFLRKPFLLHDLVATLRRVLADE